MGPVYSWVHNLRSIMNRLASILTPAQVLVRVEVTSKKRAFEEARLFKGALFTGDLNAHKNLRRGKNGS